MRHKTKNRRRGFTLIEVLMTMVVFMIGVLGLVAMQRVSAEGAQTGREHTQAVNVARFFLSQLKTEVSTWQEEDEAFPSMNYTMLHFAANTGIGAWHGFPMDHVNPGNRGWRVDEFMGHSGIADDTSRYCVNYRVDPLGIPNANPTQEQIEGAMVWKLRVRVAWPRREQLVNADTTFNWKDCHPEKFEDGDPPLVREWQMVEVMAMATREIARGGAS